jgi:hypothetical protein
MGEPLCSFLGRVVVDLVVTVKPDGRAVAAWAPQPRPVSNRLPYRAATAASELPPGLQLHQQRRHHPTCCPARVLRTDAYQNAPLVPPSQ